MTRTQTRTYGVASPPHIQPLLDAVLRAFAWLVSNVVALSRTIFNRNTRDWHTDAAREDQLPAPNDITQKEAQSPQPSFSGKAAGRIPRIPVVSTQGTTPYSLCAINQDAWDKPKHDPVGVAAPRLNPILRDDRRSAPIPQDEAGRGRHKDQEALMLRDRCKASIVSKHAGGLTALSSGSVEHAFPAQAGIQSARKARSSRTHARLSFRAKAHSAADPEPSGDAGRHHHVRLLGSRFRGNDSVGVRINLA